MIIPDDTSVGFTFNGEHLCRYCTHDALQDIVYENAYRLPGETEGLGVWDLMRICDTFRDGEPMTLTFQYYDTDTYDSNDYPKPFEDAEPEERCMNPECERELVVVYNESLRR